MLYSLPIFITNSIEKVILVNKLPILYGTLRFIIIFIKADKSPTKNAWLSCEVVGEYPASTLKNSHDRFLRSQYVCHEY
jgi:hypothetical protein